MEQDTRACADCGSDISGRHWRSKRCQPCQREHERLAMNTKAPTTYAKTCERCEQKYTTTNRHQRFCGTRCAGLASHPGVVERTCMVCGEEFSISRQFDRDTCSRNCARASRLHPGRKKASHCARCHGPIKRVSTAAIYCSQLCAAVAGEARRAGRVAAIPRQFCLSCGGPLVGRTARAMYCSRACQAVRGKERRAAKIAGAPVERVYPIDIYERDEWTCHLCRAPIDPHRTERYDPERVSLDHIIPVAASGFPGHVWENLAAAHLRCNIVKGDAVTEHDRALYRTLLSRRGANLHKLATGARPGQAPGEKASRPGKT